MSEPTIELAEHTRGSLTPEQLNQRIAEIWHEKIGSEAGRGEISEALELRPDDLRNAPAPISVETAGSGFAPTVLIILGSHLLLSEIVIPAAKDALKDVVKERLVRLWKQVLLPAIRREDENAIDEAK